MKTLVLKLTAITLLVVMFSAGAANDGFEILSPVQEEADNDVEQLFSQSESKLTPEQAIEIAITIEEIKLFVVDSKAHTEAWFDGFGLWIISFYPTLYDGVWLDAFVDDQTAKLIDFYYTDIAEEFIFTNPELETAALEFVAGYELTSDFFTAHPDMELFASSSVDFVNIWGYHSDTWISIDLSATKAGDTTWTFDLLGLSSNDIFGSPVHDFSEVSSILAGLNVVMDFIANNPEYNMEIVLGLYMDEVSVIGEFSDNIYSGYMYSISFYSGDGDVVAFDGITTDATYSWLTIYLDDATGDIIDHWAPVPSQLTEQEAIGIALTVPAIAELVQDLTNYDIFAYFDDFGYWYVEIFDIEGNYASILIDDDTSEVIDYFISIPISASMTEAEVIALVLAIPEVAEWTLGTTYDIFVFYDGFGLWTVDLYGESWIDFVFIQIDDATSEVLSMEIYKSVPSTMTEEEVLAVVNAAGLADFLLAYPDAIIELFYDGWSWFVSAHHPVFMDAYVFANVNDLTGELVHYYESYLLVEPTMSITEVQDLVHTHQNYTDFLALYIDIEEYISYSNGLWFVDISAITVSGEFDCLTFVVDDATGTITDVYSCFYPGVPGEPGDPGEPPADY